MTPQEIDTLRPLVFADPSCQPFLQAADANGLTAHLNGLSGQTAWRSDAPVNAILNAITWASYTPNDAIAGSDTDPLLSVKIGRLLTVQTKQMNLQLMLQGRDRLDTRPSNVRLGLRDAVTQLPTGANGANTSPGGGNGTAVLEVCVRPANRVETLMAAPSQASDTTGTVQARVLRFEGSIEPPEVGGLMFNDDGTPRWV
jgi:hypothetical protein